MCVCVCVWIYVFIYLWKYWLLLSIIIASKWLWPHLETRFVITKANNLRLISPSTPIGNFCCSLHLPALAACCRTFYSVCRNRNLQQLFFLPWRNSPSGPGPSHYRGFKITLRHTPFGKTPLGEWSAWRRDLYLTTYITHKTQTSMPLRGIRNPQSQQADCRRPTPQTAQPPGSANKQQEWLRVLWTSSHS